LTQKELDAALTVLLQMDENEDEIVTTREIAPNAGSKNNPLGALMAMGGPGQKEKPTSSPLLVPVLTPGEVPADLVTRMMERYGTKAKDQEKLSRKDLGLDETTSLSWTPTRTARSTARNCQLRQADAGP